jgi:aspartate aminotransferase
MTSTYSVSSNVSQLKESATIAVSQRARALKAQGRQIIDLGAGEPDFDTPAFIRRAAQRALEDGGGATKYTAVEGILPLRQAIADISNEGNQCEPVGPGDVVVTTGSKQALFNSCFALFGEDDEVLVPTPAWTSYYEMVDLSRARAVAVPGDASRGFKVTADELERHATENTRGVMLNSPCNPTGSVYTVSELDDLVRLAAERNWWVISDEIYRRIAYDGPAAGLLSVARSRERIIVIDGMAKSFAMTGWRIGWAIANSAVIKSLVAFQSHTTSNATTVAQYAALEALRNRSEADAAIAAMVVEYKRRRDAALMVLHKPGGPRVVNPDGAFYLYIDVQDTNPGNEDAGSVFAARLLEEQGVAVVPGAAFRTNGWIRLSYAAALEAVVEGVTRIVKLREEMTHG